VSLASIGAPKSLLEDDLEELERLQRQTSMRKEHLQNLEPAVAPIPLEQQIEPVELSIHTDFKIMQKMVHAFAGVTGVGAVGVGGILYRSGPFGFALLAGDTVATAVITAFARHDDGESGQDGLKKALANIAELADTIGKRVSAELSNFGKEIAKVVFALTPDGQKKPNENMA